MSQQNLPDVTDEEAAMLRELFEEIIVPRGNQGNTKHLHIVDDGEPLCGTYMNQPKVKSVAVYPWHPWCTKCAAEWRESVHKS